MRSRSSRTCNKGLYVTTNLLFSRETVNSRAGLNLSRAPTSLCSKLSNTQRDRNLRYLEKSLSLSRVPSRNQYKITSSGNKGSTVWLVLRNNRSSISRPFSIPLRMHGFTRRNRSKIKSVNTRPPSYSLDKLSISPKIKRTMLISPHLNFKVWQTLSPCNWKEFKEN